MVFWQADTLELEAFRPGIASRATIGNDLIMVCLEIEAAQEDAGHVHDFDQCGMVMAGRLEMFVGEERKVLAAHDCYFIPAGRRHGWRTFGEPARLLDVCRRQPAG